MGSGQDAEWHSGLAWPDPRFVANSELVQDRLTGLFWTRNANIPELPMTSAFEPDWAWALYLDKGAVGVGQKAGAYFHVWPVCDQRSL